MRIFLNLQYNGSNYHGWQIQPNAISVQEIIEKGLSLILKNKIEVVGCGRTDTGVHASDFYLHFDLNNDLPYSLEQLKYKLNGFLPPDIKIIKAFIPDNQEFHARFSAKERTYRYTIITEKDPFLFDFAYHFPYKLNLELMNEASEILREYVDFSCFSKTGTQVATNNCVISYAKWERHEHIVDFTISADRFLRNMVRAICGTMLDIGTEKISLDDFEAVIESKSRNNAGASVPAKGLCLIKVEY